MSTNEINELLKGIDMKPSEDRFSHAVSQILDCSIYDGRYFCPN